MSSLRRPNWALLAYISALAALAVVVAALSHGAAPAIAQQRSFAALIALGALAVAAEYLFVRFRFGGETNAINLMEAVLAPVILFHPPTTVVATVAATQVVAAIVRKNSPTKGAFNVAQWSLAAGCGAIAAASVAGRGGDVGMISAVLVGLTAVAVVNQAAFTVVVTIANRQRLRTVARALRPVMLRGWAASWALNSMIGLLFVFAFDRHPIAVLLFPVPLAVLHLAYRGYAGARTDRMRLTGVHAAVSVLAEPLEPHSAIDDFLRLVAESFEARMAVLAITTDDGAEIHVVDASTGAHRLAADADGLQRLASRVAEMNTTMRIAADGEHPLRPFLSQHDVRDALVAPVVRDGTPIGALMVFDQSGIEGFEEGELAVFDALARETSGVFTRGALVAAVLDERRATSEIVDSTSDGILTISHDGMIRSWNRALEAITGFAAADAIGHPAALVLRPTTAAGQAVALERWIENIELPSDLQIVAADGSRRTVSCSYGTTSDAAAGKMVVVVRDLTPAQQVEELRQELGRLEAAEAAHRAVVAALQDAVLPAPPDVDDLEFAVGHIPSDENAPTGGDLYDWHVLPDGTVHIAVTDVLGHGVRATKHALAVTSTLRLLAIQNCALADIVATADVLLRAQDPELVATVVIGRYDPRTGRLSIASGGHPPALLVSASGETSQISAPGSAIGWPEAGSDVLVDVELSPGDALVFYTDGLIEARRNILDGLDALTEHAAALASLPAEKFVEELMTRALGGAERLDDSLALVVRRRAQPQVMRFEVPGVSSSAREARHRVQSFLAANGVASEVVDDLTLATSELVTNSANAGAAVVNIAIELGSGRIVLDVTDDARGHPELVGEGIEQQPDFAESGRGLFLVRAVADDISILSTAEGTSVRIQKQAESHRDGIATMSAEA